MKRQDHLLMILAEECGELTQRASKAFRFGLKEVEPGQELDNAERLLAEFNDLIGAMELLYENEMLPYLYNQEKIDAKKRRVEYFFERSREHGRLE